MKTFTKIWLGIAFVALGFGIILIIIVLASGGAIVDIPTISYQDRYTGVTDIDLDIEYAEVKVIQGDSFSIDAENIPENGLESYVENGTWIVKQSGDHVLNFFGEKIQLGYIRGHRWWNYDYPKITITIPADFTADSFKLEVGAGNVNIEEVIALKADFNVQAGQLVIEDALISNESNYTVGAGNMELKNIKANDISVDCGAGQVFIEGKITGNNDITCGVGHIELNLEGEEDDYSYDIESGLGDINIENKHYHSITDKRINNDGAVGAFKLDCSVGNITVDFR